MQKRKLGSIEVSPMGNGFLSGRCSAGVTFGGDDIRRVITLFVPENVNK